MASGPITSMQTEVEKLEGVTDFIFLGSKFTTDGDCSCEIKKCLLIGRKAMTNLASVLKSRDIILLTKVYIVKTKLFPVVMYGCESWSTNKTEPQSLCFHIVVQKTPESPLDSKEITAVNPTGNQPRIFPGNTVAEAPIL